MKKLSIILMATAMIASLSSCLKDGKVNLAPGASPPVVEWATAALDDAPANNVANIYRTYTRSYPIVAANTMNLSVDLTGTDAASSDITVSVGVKAQAVADYNAKYATTYTLMPTNFYTMPTSVTIPSGGRAATVGLVVNTTLFDLTKTYAIPVTITSTSFGGISANYGTVIYLVSAKNKYDGVYTLDVGSGSTLNPGIHKTGGKLATTGPNSVTTSLLQTYSNQITYTFDPATNKIVSISDSGLGAASSIDPSSGYDPATKKITANYVIGTRTFQEVYTYTGVR